MNYEYIRGWFEKFDEAVYLSHLDIVGCFTRAFSTSDLPLWYTEGFNPHLYISFPSPLSLGVGGARECFEVKLPKDYDLRLLNNEVETLNKNLPKGLKILSFSFPKMPASQICCSEFEILFKKFFPDVSDLENFFKQKVLLVEKVTKSKSVTLDLKENIKSVDIKTADGVPKISIVLTLYCSPFLVTEALNNFFGKRLFLKITRKCVLNNDLQVFS